MCFFYLFIYYLFWFLRLTFVHYINASSQTGLYIYNMTFSLQQTTKQYWYQKLLYVYYWIILWRSKIEYSSVTIGCRENCFSSYDKSKYFFSFFKQYFPDKSRSLLRYEPIFIACQMKSTPGNTFKSCLFSIYVSFGEEKKNLKLQMSLTWGERSSCCDTIMIPVSSLGQFSTYLSSFSDYFLPRFARPSDNKELGTLVKASFFPSYQNDYMLFPVI